MCIWGLTPNTHSIPFHVEGDAGLNKRRSGAIASYAYTICQMVVGLIYVPLLLGGIGRAEYGLYQFIGSIIAYITIVNTTLGAGVTRFYCKYLAEGDEDGMANTLAIATKAIRIISVIAVVVGVACMFVVRAVYVNSFTAWELDESCLLLGVLVLNLIVTMSNTVSASVITAHEEFVFLKLTQLAVIVVQPIAVVIAIQWFANALAVCVVQLVLNFALRMVQHGFARSKLGMDAKLRYADEQLQKDLLRFSGGIVMGVVADEIFWRTDQLILGYYYGTQTVAVYAVGAQICLTYMPLGQAVASVFMPKVSRIAEAPDCLYELSLLFAKVARLSGYPLLLVLTGFIVFGQDFIRLWAGDGFQEAYWVAVVIMVPFTVDIMQSIGIVILQVLDKYAFRGKMYLVAAIVNVGITIVLAREFGCIGAAAATGLTLFVVSDILVNFYYSRSVGLDMLHFWKQVARFALPIVPLCAAGIFAWQAIAASVEVGWGVLLAGIVAYTVVFAAYVFIFSADSYERGLARSVLAKFKK